MPKLCERLLHPATWKRWIAHRVLRRTHSPSGRRFAEYRARLFESPELYAASVDPSLNRFVFVPMTRDRYIEESFHDSRFLLAGSPDRIQVSFADLWPLFDRREHRDRSAHFIFHLAFGGSTLISRYLDKTNQFVGYREPSILVQLGDQKYQGFRDCDAVRWTRTLEIATALLARTHAPHQAAVVKLNDRCTNLFDE